MRPLRNLTLELSAKALMAGGCAPALQSAGPRALFRQWRALADNALRLSVLLWVSDGSELLDWSGDFADTFEWACWCGCANHLPQPANPTPRQRRDTHRFPAKVFPEEVCAPLPYSWLRDAVAAIRAAARAELGREVRVGTILDAGPEFAISDFKFRRHTEAMVGRGLFPKSFLSCASALHADTRRYAAFPEGIPEGTSFGAFLGAQYRSFARDFGFDYLWLSNGLGFGDEPWGVVGSLFDGERFHPERAADASARMLGFWRDFFAAAPGAVVETRGSNFSAGVEIASDAAPLGELYGKGMIEPPVNSPWAALNFNTGLELAAWMSHVAELPTGRGFPFRFYIHDPWFLNSPWLDRYAREPWDIFAPLSVCRLREDGSVQTPDSLALLSADDTIGRMPDQVPLEVTPHLLDALATAPDVPGPLVWIYPFEEYAAIVSRRDAETQREKAGGEGCKVKEEALTRIFNEDLFLGEALQGGLPLNTVISTRNWRTLAKGSSHKATEPQSYSLSTNTDANLRVSVPLCDNKNSSLFILPVSALLSAENLAALDAWEARGAKFLIYGPLADAPATLLDRLGLALAEPLEGEATVETAAALHGDIFASGAPCDRLFVNPSIDAGGLCEVPAPSLPTAILATATFPNGASRILASCRGAFAYVRSALPFSAADRVTANHFSHAPATGAFPAERLMRHILGSAFGWGVRAELPTPATLPPRLNVHRHDNAFVLHAFAPDTTAALRVRTPLGAPLPTEHETMLDGGDAVWHPAKSWRRECRLFVEGQDSGIVSVKTGIAAYPGYAGHLQVRGLENATLRFFPPENHADTIELVRSEWCLLGEDVVPVEWEDSGHGRCAVWRGVTGPVFIAW